jgi:hypothetical protein
MIHIHITFQDTEQWEKELLSCTKEKSAVSVHISIDTSGSTKYTDPNGSNFLNGSIINIDGGISSKLHDPT